MNRFIFIIIILVTYLLIFITHLNILYKFPNLSEVASLITIGLYYIITRFIINKIIG